MEIEILKWLVFRIIALTIIWAIFAFIAWNPTWFLDSVVGRIVAILFLFFVIGTETD